MDWASLYPDFFPPRDAGTPPGAPPEPPPQVEFADVGCGYGGLLVEWGRGEGKVGGGAEHGGSKGGQ